MNTETYTQQDEHVEEKFELIELGSVSEETKGQLGTIFEAINGDANNSMVA